MIAKLLLANPVAAGWGALILAGALAALAGFAWIEHARVIERDAQLLVAAANYKQLRSDANACFISVKAAEDAAKAAKARADAAIAAARTRGERDRASATRLLSPVAATVSCEDAVAETKAMLADDEESPR